MIMSKGKMLKNIIVYNEDELYFEAVPGARIENAVEDSIKYLVMNNREGFYDLYFNGINLKVNALSLTHRVIKEYFNAMQEIRNNNI